MILGGLPPVLKLIVEKKRNLQDLICTVCNPSLDHMSRLFFLVAEI